MLLKEISYAIRCLLKRPAFTALTITTLALGIGANTAIFSVVNGVLLRPLPYPEPERLLRIWETNVARGGELEMTSLSNLLDWRRQSRSLEFAAWQRLTSLTLTSQSPAVELKGSVVSDNYFSLLGVPAALGRTFTADESTLGHTRVAVISDELWRRQFGSNPQIGESKIQLEMTDFQIIGVMPRGFKSPAGEVDLWLPMNLQPNKIDRGQTYLQVIGRLNHEITLNQAQAEMDGIATALALQFPNSNRDRGIRLISLSEHMVGRVRRHLLIVLGAVGLVLFIACANVANLFMVRAAKQQHDIAIRAALGASRGRLVRQFLSEALVVAACSGALGLFASVWVLALLRLLAPGQLPRLDEVSIDGPTLLFAMAATLVTGILSGLIPALYFLRPNLSDALKNSDSRLASSGRRQNRLQSAFVVLQVAVALIVLSGAGLLIRSFVGLVKVNPGFDSENLFVARIVLGDDYSEDNRQVTYFQELTKRLQSVPGVSAVGAATVLPMGSFGIDFDVPYHRDEQADLPRSATPKAKFRAVTPEYFHAIGMPLIRGRSFIEHDRHDSPRVVVVNEMLAERTWPGENAIGKRLRFFWSDWQTYEVVGVVGNTKSYGLVEDSRPELFVPEAQIPYTVMNVVIRSKVNASVITAEVRRTVLELDPYQPPHSIIAMSDLVSDSIARERFAMTWLGVLAAISLALACVGIYSIIAYVTAQRTREVGIRLALGARPVDVLRLVVRHGMSLTVIGLAIGLAGALVLTRLLEGLLFGVTPNDLATLISVSGLLLVVALVASYIPARRASKVDPLVALRYE